MHISRKFISISALEEPCSLFSKINCSRGQDLFGPQRCGLPSSYPHQIDNIIPSLSLSCPTNEQTCIMVGQERESEGIMLSKERESAGMIFLPNKKKLFLAIKMIILQLSFVALRLLFQHFQEGSTPQFATKTTLASFR